MCYILQRLYSQNKMVMKRIDDNDFFFQERFRIANDYIQKIVELKRVRTPDALQKIFDLKRIIRSLYGLH